MSIRDQRDAALKRARSAKQRKVAEASGPDAFTDLVAVVEGWRGTEHVVTLFPVAGEQRDAALGAAHGAAVGLGCDTLAVTLETRKATMPNNPVTGRPWGPGEMQQVALEHDGLAKGWVTDCLTTMVVNRAGDLADGYQSYRVTGRTNALGLVQYDLEWLGEPQLGDEGKVSGIIPDALQRFMREPSLQAMLATLGTTAETFGIDDPEVAQAHQDCGAVKAMWQGGYEGAVLLSAGEGSARAEVINRSLKGMGAQRLGDL